MRVFHYTRADKWEDIANGSSESKNIPGLAAKYGMGDAYTVARTTSAVFALLEPIPHAWAENSNFKYSWSALKRHLGRLLLEVDVDPLNDHVFVIDRAHVEGYIYRETLGIPKKYLHNTLESAERAYVESKIPLRDYNTGTHSLPEVIITEQVPLEKIKISQEQPFIDEDLEIYTDAGIQRIISKLERVPKIAELYRQRILAKVT